MGEPFDRETVSRLRALLVRDPPLIQIVTGPRQVGKTTAARAVAKSWDGEVHFVGADGPVVPGPEWIETNWSIARSLAKERPSLLVLDEVQKAPSWSESAKAMWDADRASGANVRVILLGSSALLLSSGMAESLAGRFFLHRCPHWSYPEMRRAFGWDLERWIFYGGYPGAAPFVDEPEDWRRYVADSLVETAIARDVLGLSSVGKPALLRHLFLLAASAPCEIMSYNKMLGQLQDAGNTTTLAHYLRLLEGAFLLSGLERFSGGRLRKRGSSPKLVLWNNALVTALGTASFERCRRTLELWGRLVENAVGAHLLNHLQGIGHEVRYWRERSREIDFAVRTPDGLYAVEVKSGRPRRPPGLAAFVELFPEATPLVLGSGGLPLEEFFSRDPRELLGGMH